MKTFLIVLGAAVLFVILGMVVVDETKRQQASSGALPALPGPKLADAERTMIAGWEGSGLLLIEAGQDRVYFSPKLWAAAEAKNKEYLVGVFTRACADRLGGELRSIEVLDKQSGRKLASFSKLFGTDLNP